LEILTDDVALFARRHVTNIDPEQQFYLTSRGIPGKEGVED
jgi:Fe-S cluster assembly scaffold protein SufB